MKIGGILRAASLFLALLAAGACSQDAIFHEISRETKPLEPRIKGTPTNMAVFKRKGQDLLFVASGSSLHWYSNPSGTEKSPWNKGDYATPKPGGDIHFLAATSAHLYAIAGSNLRRIGGSDTEWQTVTKPDGAGALQTVYAAGPAGSERVFVAAGGDGDTFSIFEVDDITPSAPKLVKKSENTGMLTGAVYDGTDYYLSTASKGIYISLALIVSSTSKSDGKFQGIILLPSGQVAAMARDGQLYSVSASGLILLKKIDKPATRALCLWFSAGQPKLLLAGAQDTAYSANSGYTHGYREFRLGADGGVTAEYQYPGSGNPTSVSDRERYNSSIGKHPVNHIFQVPASVDAKMTLFASTDNNGLWSYRERNKIPQWNAEE